MALSLGCSQIITVAVGLVTADSTPTSITAAVLGAIWLYSMAIYTISGYRLFNTEENNCGIVRETSSWNTVMIVLMIVGSVFVLYAGIITLMVPCIGIAFYFAIRGSRLR